jgi:hypothetical protein
MENRDYNNNNPNRNHRKRRILPDFITRMAWKSDFKRRRLNYRCRRLYNMAASGNRNISTPDIKESLPDDILKLVFKFSYAQNFTTELEFIKYKFTINEDLRLFQRRLEKFLIKYNPLPYQIQSLILIIADKHRKYRYNSNEYPIFLYDVISLIKSYIGGCGMTNRIRDSCSCQRRCNSCIKKELRVAYLLHILDHSRNLRLQLYSRNVQKELSMRYMDLRKNGVENHWIVTLYNDIMFNPDSNCHISRWNRWQR